MLKDTDSIEIGFENCDTVEVKRAFIESLCLEDIVCSVGMCANAVIEHEVAKYAYIELDKGCFNNKSWLGEDLDKRILNFQDIVDVELHFNDGTSRSIGILWGKDDEYSNSLQKTHITTYGNLIIEINA